MGKLPYSSLLLHNIACTVDVLAQCHVDIAVAPGNVPTG